MVNPGENSKNCRLQFSIASPQLGTSSEHPDASLDVYRTERWSHKPPPHRHRSAFPTWLPLITIINKHTDTHVFKVRLSFTRTDLWRFHITLYFPKKFLYQNEAQHVMLSVHLYVWHFCDAGLTKLTKWLGSSMMSGICQNLPYMHGLWTQHDPTHQNFGQDTKVSPPTCSCPCCMSLRQWCKYHLRKGNNWNNQRPS